MEKETFKIIAIHPENGVLVKKLELTSKDEEFLEDEEGFDSFGEYVEYTTSEEAAGLEQAGYTTILASEYEVGAIIKELSK
jgi:hypothetical protein